MSLIHISYAGPTRHIIDAKGKRWTFEMHPYCGPVVLNRHGDPALRQPGEKSPFWNAVTRWTQTGQKLNDAGECIWEPEKKPVFQHIVGKHYRVTGWE